jgi:hypothetical protein
MLPLRILRGLRNTGWRVETSEEGEELVLESKPVDREGKPKNWPEKFRHKVSELVGRAKVRYAGRKGFIDMFEVEGGVYSPSGKALMEREPFRCNGRTLSLFLFRRVYLFLTGMSRDKKERALYNLYLPDGEAKSA